MRRRILSVLICVAIFIAVFPLTVHASKDSDEICRKMVSDYQMILASEEKESMLGYCGTVVGWQLYLTGVNSWVIKADGNGQYDLYKDMEWTSGGHRVKTYPIEEYPTLLDALNAATYNGKKDVYNLLVGFESTNTEAGQEYGHACVIYAILDGRVYFTESFSSGGGNEGYPRICTVEEFAAAYAWWTVYEGTVEFGRCPGDRDLEAVDVYVEARDSALLLAQPDPESKSIRTLRPGERLHAMHLSQREGVYYYQIDDGAELGYVPAKKTRVIMVNPDSISLTGLRVPEKLTPEKPLRISGSAITFTDTVERVQATVSQDGETVLEASVEDCGGICQLDQLQLGSLQEGAYTVTVTAQIASPIARYGRPHTVRAERVLYTGDLLVTEEELPEQTPEKAVRPDGWSYENGRWYYWKDGKPGSGWLTENGMRYYLLDDGAAATGVITVGNSLRRFSPTGVLVTGWGTCEDGVRYWLSNGMTATGWQKIGGTDYHFDEDGILTVNAWVEKDGQSLYMGGDGAPGNGWIEGETGRLFLTDGRIRAELSNDSPVIRFRKDAQNGGK